MTAGKETSDLICTTGALEYVAYYFIPTVTSLCPRMRIAPVTVIGSQAAREAHARRAGSNCSNQWARRCELGRDEFVERWAGFDPTAAKGTDPDNPASFFMVRNPNAKADDMPREAEEAFREEFNTMKNAGKVTRTSLLDNAEWFEIKSAKWMMFVDQDAYPDDPKAAFLRLWQDLARATAEGRLSADVLHVSTQGMVKGHSCHKINVGVRDFTDKALLERSAREVYAATGYVGRMACKPDAFTVLGLRAGNEFGLKKMTVGCCFYFKKTGLKWNFD